MAKFDRYKEYQICDDESLTNDDMGKNEYDEDSERTKYMQNYSSQGHSYRRKRTNRNKSLCTWKVILVVATAFVGGMASGIFISLHYDWTGAGNKRLMNDEAYLYSTKFQALREKILKILVEVDDGGGPFPALVEMSRAMDDDDILNNNCHHLVHHLGRAAYRQIGLSGAFEGVLLTENAVMLRVCNGAYMHGVIESHLKQSEDPVKAAMDLEERVCAPLKGSPTAEWECYHGIGHGFMQKMRDERDRMAIDDAFKACQGIQKDDMAGCENGVWMDYFVSSRFEGSFSFDITSSASSLELCTDISALDVPGECAAYVPTEYLLHRPRDYEGAFQWCLAGNADDLLQKYCVAGVGMQAAKENLRDFGLVETVCLAASTEELGMACAKSAFNYHGMATLEMTMPVHLCHQMSYFEEACLNYK